MLLQVVTPPRNALARTLPDPRPESPFRPSRRFDRISYSAHRPNLRLTADHPPAWAAAAEQRVVVSPRPQARKHRPGSASVRTRAILDQAKKAAEMASRSSVLHAPVLYYVPEALGRDMVGEADGNRRTTHGVVAGNDQVNTPGTGFRLKWVVCASVGWNGHGKRHAVPCWALGC